MIKNQVKIIEDIQHIKNHAEEIDKNKNYQIISYRTDYDKKITDKNVTQCTKCSAKRGTCHFNCSVGDGEDKQNCAMMDFETGLCSHCGCSWRDHVNSREYYVEKKVKVDHTDETLLAKYTDAQTQMKKSAAMLKLLADELIKNAETIVSCREAIQRCNTRLQKYAAKKISYIEDDFFESQINAIREAQEEGWQKQISIL